MKARGGVDGLTPRLTQTGLIGKQVLTFNLKPPP